MKKVPDFLKNLLADRIPLITAAVIMFVGPFVPNIIMGWITDPFYNGSNITAIQMVWCAGSILICFLWQYLFERWFRSEYKGSLTFQGFGYGMKLSIPLIIFWMVWLLGKAALGFVDHYAPDLEAILKGFRPGVCEETIFRGIAVALLLKKYRKKENIWVPVIFTSVFFGLTHFTNLDSMDELPWLTVTVAFAAVFGIVVGCIFTLSGSVWPTIIVHSLYDTALICMPVRESAPDWQYFIDFGGMVLLMIWLLIIFHKRREEASALWNTKWQE